MTPSDLFTQALKGAGVIGVGQTASAEDLNDCMFQANLLLDDWSVRRWMVFHTQDISKVSTGALSYTVGTGGDFNVARPDRVEAAFFRQIIPSQPNQIDFPLLVLDAREDYNRIALKTLNSWPECAFYDPAYPMGNLFVWPVPLSGVYEIHITVKAVLSEFTNLAQTINLPPVYRNAIFWNLCGVLRPLYQLPPDSTVTAKAKSALASLRKANTQIAAMQMPSALIRGGGRAYNIFSDT